MPSAPVSPGSDYISSNWYASQGFYGAENVQFVQDPFSANSTTTVLKVNYPAGSYAPVGTKNNNSGVKGGAEFFTNVNHDTMYNTALLSYDLAFDSSFDWVKGGKLPGIYGGSPGDGCSGGEKATGANCFSVRLMWRDSGAGEAYAYIPTSDKLCSSKQVTCNSDYGTSFSRGVIRFSTAKWTHIDMYIKLNTGSNTNGILQVWQDGSLMINQQHLQFRSSDAVGMSSTMFSTFFGGGSTSFATPVDTSTTADTPDPTQGNSASTSCISYYYISAIVAVLFFI
ncbi:uncharacterized protein EV154DRAFT_536893 [Mucor mucedo]|uniref:uncharacterized protein n=1 Tax=Mucor mucedo TaxID=29922 RepID=UPI00221FE3C8|nr:uncharacterized protein EV154DRAFT_536893 [Mucor mucedo]KAI7893720.1 hypothetical protein EV154DRAFT_536893 [Mucor mucedo]